MKRVCGAAPPPPKGGPGSHHTPTHHILLFQRKGWRRPTLPHPPRCSTIGAGRLSFRVRKGTGRDPTALTTNTIYKDNTHPTQCVAQDTEQWTQATNKPSYSATEFIVVSFGQLVPVTSTPHNAYRSGLSTPSSLGNLKRNLIMKQASRLDAFSGYPSRT